MYGNTIIDTVFEILKTITFWFNTQLLKVNMTIHLVNFVEMCGQTFGSNRLNGNTNIVKIGPNLIERL